MTLEEALRAGGVDPYMGLHYARSEALKLVQIAATGPGTYVRMRPIGGGQVGIFDTIANFLNQLLSYLQPWAMFDWLRIRVFDPFKAWLGSGFLNPLVSSVTGAFYWVSSVLSSTVGDLRNIINHWLSVLWSALEGVRGSLPSAGQVALSWVMGQILPPLWAVQQIIGWIPDPIKDALRDEWVNLTVFMRRHWEVLSAALDRIVAAASAGFSILTWAISDPLVRIPALFSTLVNTIGARIFEALWPLVQGAWTMITTTLRELWRQISPRILETAELAIATARPYVEHWAGEFSKLPGTYLNYIASVAGSNLALEPERALSTAGSLYAMSIGAGTLAMTTATALNIIPTTNWVGAQQLAAFIAQVAGFDPLTNATYGVLVNECLAWPMRYHWHRVLRPKLPTEGTIFLMGRKRGISRGEFMDAMAYQGIPDPWLEKMYRFFWTDPSPYWLLRMSEAAVPKIEPSSTFLPWLEEWLPNWRTDPWAWYKMKLMLAGFEDTDIPAFIEGFQRRTVQTAVTQFKTSVRAMVRKGYWGRTEVHEGLRPLGVREEEIELLMAAEDLDYQEEYLDDEAQYYIELFRKGEISEQDLSLLLSTIIMRPERVGQIVARERVRALPKPKTVVPVKESSRVKSLVTQAVNSWLKRYRSWEIGLEELGTGLLVVLRDPELVDAMLEVELTRYREPPPVPPLPPEDPLITQARRQAIASWITQYREEQIPIEELELGLLHVIEDPEIVGQLVQIEQLRARPVPELLPPEEEDPELARLREETVRGYIEQFHKRLIGPELLYVYLLAAGLAAPIARATVITQATKRIQVPRLDSPYYLQDHLREIQDQGLEAYQELYIDGEITLIEFTTWARSLGVDDAIVTYLGDLLTLRRFMERGVLLQ